MPALLICWGWRNARSGLLVHLAQGALCLHFPHFSLALLVLLHLEDSTAHRVEQLIALLRVQLLGVETILGSQVMLELLQTTDTFPRLDHPLGGVRCPVTVLEFLFFAGPGFSKCEVAGDINILGIHAGIDLVYVRTGHGGVFAKHVHTRGQIALRGQDATLGGGLLNL